MPVPYDIIGNIFKTRYEIMDKLITPKITEGLSNMIFIMDIGHVLDMMMDFREIKDTSEMEEIDEKKICVSILNILAHYRHYIRDKLKIKDNTLIIYCEQQAQYDKYSNIIERLDGVLKFIPKLILIPRFEKVERFFYIHFICYCLKIKKAKFEDNCGVLIYGNNPYEYQYAMIVKRTYFLCNPKEPKLRTIYDMYKRNFNMDDERIKSVLYARELKNLLYPLLIYLKRLPEYKTKITKSNKLRMKSIADTMFKYIEDHRTASNLYEGIGHALQYTDDDITACGNILREIMYYNDVSMNLIVVNILKSISKKLKDKEIYYINDYSGLFTDEIIRIDWLIGE